MSGHGFYQFSSDLIFSLYSSGSGFSETRVFYASDFNVESWYEVEESFIGNRLEVCSIEPIFLLSVTKKVKEFHQAHVQQPLYLGAWSSATDKEPADGPFEHFKKLRGFLLRRQWRFISLIRNLVFIVNLGLGFNRFSVRRFRRVSPKSSGSRI